MTEPSDREVAARRPERPERPDILRPPQIPAAADGANAPSPRRGLGTLYLLTLLSTVDGSLLLLAANGQLSSLGGALVVGLTVIAGAGSWLAARQAFDGRRSANDWLALGVLGVLTLAATVVSVWLGATLGSALTLHVLPKAGGVVLLLVAAEVAGLRLPKTRGVPLPLAAIAAAGVLEGVAQWSLS